MWADTLQSAERLHLLRLLVWGVANIVTGTALFAWLHASGRQSSLLRHFAAQCVAWGVGEAAIAATLVTHVYPRDVAAATHLDRILWLTIGLDIGGVTLGAAFIAAGWTLGRRLGMVGAGIAIVMQGLAILVINLAWAAVISR